MTRRRSWSAYIVDSSITQPTPGRTGSHGREIARDKAPCAEVTAQAGTVVVSNLQQDPRFSDSVLARSGIRFYAGAPLVTRDGHTLGAMCVLDSKPRETTLRAWGCDEVQGYFPGRPMSAPALWQAMTVPLPASRLR